MEFTTVSNNRNEKKKSISLKDSFLSRFCAITLTEEASCCMFTAQTGVC